ncbi:phosphatase PAP2 family protein [Nocardia yamanashiensis]|uniref:phosphatase PAP2 family protein n=1 Tax=Nocardia yamanashiensis TaxID=209247 RepID=UPI000829653E|nr:phosphatase PAP2 family protein [Nocardia yamanashiensis]
MVAVLGLERKPAVLAGAAVLVVGAFVVVTVLVGAGGVVTGWDRGVWEWFVGHRSAGWTTVVKEYTYFGNPQRATVIAGVAAGWVGWRRRSWWDGVVIAGTVAGAAGVGTVVKWVVDRGRPPVGLRLVSETSMSYPSGHATATTALVGVLALMYMETRPGRGKAVAAGVFGAVVVGLMCATRLYLGVHWFSDVVGGVLLGSSAVLIAGVAQGIRRAGAGEEGDRIESGLGREEPGVR